MKVVELADDLPLSGDLEQGQIVGELHAPELVLDLDDGFLDLRVGLEVRAHELAHITAGGGLITRGAAYTYETGPDGQRYAVGGDVGIDVSPGRTPQETLARAEQVRRAALAPADPSAQDRQVAARADQMAFQAQQTIAAQATSGTDPTSDTPPPGSLIDVYA